jgi:LacI family transcriptional regulator
VANRKNKITIHDLARKSGVSAGTIDRVIHNRAGVSDNTRKQVMKFIKLLDYQPDILARTLANRKLLRLAAIYPGLKSGKTFWDLPKAGMDKAVSELAHFGVQLSCHPFDLSDPASFLRQAQKIFNSAPDGIILAPDLLKEAKWFTQQCRNLNIPLVYINSKLDNCETLSSVGQDSYASGKVASGLLNGILQREKVIAILNIEQYPETRVHIKEREMGFIDYSAKRFGKSDKNIFIFNIAGSTAKSIGSELKKIFNEHRVDGVYITNSRAYLIAEWLEKHKKYRPLIIGYDLIAENRKFMAKGLIRFLISQKPEEQGYRSVITLFNHLVLAKKVEKTQLLPIDIITSENLPYYTT